jgi:hypothetical protein
MEVWDWKHCWEAQVRWTPSQVTELVPTVQVVVPLQESCWFGAEQLKVQQYGAEHSKSRMEQPFEQVRVAVHPVAEAGRASASRQAMKEKAMTAERREAFIDSPFSREDNRVLQFVQMEILRRLKMNSTREWIQPESPTPDLAKLRTRT